MPHFPLPYQNQNACFICPVNAMRRDLRRVWWQRGTNLSPGEKMPLDKNRETFYCRSTGQELLEILLKRVSGN